MTTRKGQDARSETRGKEPLITIVHGLVAGTEGPIFIFRLVG